MRIKDTQKYSKIAIKVLEQYKIDEEYQELDTITWGDLSLMELLFEAFCKETGMTRDRLREQTGCIGCSPRFKYVMDKLDKESQEEGALFKKGYICYNGIINRPTRCFTVIKK